MFGRGTFYGISQGILIIESYPYTNYGVITKYSGIVNFTDYHYLAYQMNQFCQCKRIKQKAFELAFGSRY